ncbi:winged helix-turn-helix transcriptional regulator [Shewanella dokdonensis]|uniref:Helix-turn-helix transcriptional regulator n=1 Tax=Shewanella dokdonensis TaxID=712036 RepID=A0ABX8DHL0_9GAMM|nr:helix-turn-helix domain-containing protein [Shewanella dokdonensis]MCL1075937.1 helix-turn-helix transcriptional regulator [Shewanella dokdonensis]QVK24254.1 helix-turn-helix transcriptional regulator [Shewanella dokdonensis]
MSATHIDVRTASAIAPCGAEEHEDCGLRLLLERLGERWTVMTLAELSNGPKRYREIEKALVGISQRMMTLTLRRLERDGYVLRHIDPTIPPSVTYELSALGRSFSSQVALLVTWSKEHKAELELARSTFDKKHRQP